MTPALSAEIIESIASDGYGWCTPDKAMAMAELIVDTRPNLCVELGVYSGKSLIPQALALKSNQHGYIVGIDPWQNDAAAEGDSDEANKRWWATIDLKQIRLFCEGNVRRFAVERYCATVPWRSENLAAAFQDGSVNIIHIDGNHTELASVRDVNLWLPKLTPQGYVWFDDFNWTTTAAAVRLLDERCDVVREVVNPTMHCRLYRLR